MLELPLSGAHRRSPSATHPRFASSGVWLRPLRSMKPESAEGLDSPAVTRHNAKHWQAESARPLSGG